MSLRRHHAAPALEVSVLVAAGVSKGHCAAPTRPLPSAAHTSISTAPACCRRPPTVRAAPHTVLSPSSARARAAAAAAAVATAAVHRSYGAAATSQAPVREACFLGFPLDFYFRGTKYVQHFEGLYLLFFHTICPCLFFLVLALLKFGQ